MFKVLLEIQDRQPFLSALDSHTLDSNRNAAR